MSLAAPPPIVCRDLLARLREVVRSQRLEAIVHTGCGDGDWTAELAQLGLPVVAVDVRPEAIAAVRLRLPGVSCRQGLPGRVLADLRCQLPARTLYVLGSAGVAACAVRDEIFWVPRGEGAICVLPSTADGAVSLADVGDQLLRWSPDHHVEWCATAAGGAALLLLPQPRVHVTFLIEKYTHAYGASGLSINLDNLVATLAQTGLATANVVHYDQCFHEGRPIPFEQICKPTDVDVHVLACTLHYHSQANPSPALLERARATGTKVAFFWLDKKISRSTPDYYDAADVNVVFDGNDFELPNAWPIFTPKNPVYFHDPGRERDIDVSLVGEVRYLSQRKAMVERLAAETRVQVQMFATSAADTGRALSLAEYAGLYQRSRISLAMTKDNARQLKGRVFEVLHCGAMLLCDVNHHVSHYLRPGIDYVTYRDYEDLVAKACHYLAHEDERRQIAATGHRRVVSHYNHDVFWRSLLARLGASSTAMHTADRRGEER